MRLAETRNTSKKGAGPLRQQGLEPRRRRHTAENGNSPERLFEGAPRDEAAAPVSEEQERRAAYSPTNDLFQTYRHKQNRVVRVDDGKRAGPRTFPIVEPCGYLALDGQRFLSKNRDGRTPEQKLVRVEGLCA